LTETPAIGETAPAAISVPSGSLFSEDELLGALRARRDELNISSETIDSISGLAAGHAAKLLSGHCSMGAMAFWIMLETLGLGIALIPDPAGLERLKRYANWRPRKVAPNRKRKHGNLPFVAIARRRNAPWLWNPEKAREMAKKSHVAQAKKRHAAALKSERSRRAALKRWSKPEVIEVVG
jgi:hypothetical protein